MEHRQEKDIVIVGAGAAGLMAGKLLAEAGKSVLILEARDRIGGRVHSIYDEFQSAHREAGAEFIHGKLPITFHLLKEAGLDPIATEGTMWQADDQGLHAEAAISEEWGELMEKMESLKDDMSLDDFLNTHFPGEKYVQLRESALGYARGYETADTSRASTIGLKEEWQEEMEAQAYRIREGYGNLLLKLKLDVENAEGEVLLSTVVSGIEWEAGKVLVKAVNGQEYGAKQVLITVPLGVLQAEKGQDGCIDFAPALTEHLEAARQMGFGAVIKVLLEFKERFWEQRTKEMTSQSIDNVGFILSNYEIPTWWFQHPVKDGVLTGWLGGPKAREFSGLEDEEILEKALVSLACIFKMETGDIKQFLSGWKVANWVKEPYTRGSYSYPVVENKRYQDILSSPVADTIYFAGEAICAEMESGTVEAALCSGKTMAEKMLQTK